LKKGYIVKNTVIRLVALNCLRRIFYTRLAGDEKKKEKTNASTQLLVANC